MAIAAPNLTSRFLSIPSHPHHLKHPSLLPWGRPKPVISPAIFARKIVCKATEVSVAEESAASGGGDLGKKWVPVVPLSALPKGERRVIIQEGETILLLWYKDEVFAIENRSPAEGAYSEGLINAKLTQDGCIVCPTTDSTFDLRTGAIKEWYPKNPVLRVLTPALRDLFVFPVKTDDENIYISIKGGPIADASAEIVFSGKAQPGITASDVNVDEVRMVVDEGQEAFGFTQKNELINGKAAVIGFLLLLDFELLTVTGFVMLYILPLNRACLCGGEGLQARGVTGWREVIRDGGAWSLWVKIRREWGKKKKSLSEILLRAQTNTKTRSIPSKVTK